MAKLGNNEAERKSFFERQSANESAFLMRQRGTIFN